MSFEYYLLEQHDFCKAQNQYLIKQSNELYEDLPDSLIGQFQQQNSCLEQLLCCQFRSFNLRCNLKGEDYSTAYRPRKNCFEFCGFQQQQLIITKNKIKIGSIKIPCFCGLGVYNNCAGLVLKIYDGHDKEIYHIESNLCQTSNICCCMRCCIGKIVEYKIYDNSTEPIGRIINIYNGCLMETFTKQDKFGIQIPKKLPLEHKKLLLNAPIFIDFLRYQKFI